uniref:Uncharacterized protein n=1 Tax=Lepeophtheirus salmonis TaxID=72036 RepID=A0A0K2URD5_LEPSM
MPHVALQFSFK